MKNEDIKIEKCNTIDYRFETIIDLHKQINGKTNLSGILIYYSPNYPKYFTKVISNETDNLVTTIKFKDDIAGFIHFKFIDDIVFLNNICLIDKIQGLGIGKLFLNESLKLVNIERFKYFSLDVFENNVIAFSWYKKLGLNITNSTKWLEIFTQIRKGNEFVIHMKKDANGFESALIGEKKIGTVVNNNIIVHDLKELNKMPFDKYRIIVNQNPPITFRDEYKILELETSLRMQCNLTSLLYNLK